jgi:hypothetical protein
VTTTEYRDYVEICGLQLRTERHEVTLLVRHNGHWIEVLRVHVRDLATHFVDGAAVQIAINHAAMQRALAAPGGVENK